MFEIWGRYSGSAWELLDTAEDMRERDHLLGEYRMAFGAGWAFRVKRV